MPEPERLLRDLRVINASTGIAGGYCAKLFADAGADVIKAEDPGGDPLRRWRCGGGLPDDEDGALFEFLHLGQPGLVVHTGDEFESILPGADVVITTPDGPAPAAGRLAAGHPGAVVVSISPFGLTGPYAGRPASELTIQAEGGGLAIRGEPGRPPVQAGGQVIHWVGGAYGAAAALAAARWAERTGAGTLLDVSLCEVANLTETNFFELFWTMGGRPDRATLPPPRVLESPSIEPTADGYVGFNTNGPDQFRSFLLLIDRPDLIETGEWSVPGARQARQEEWHRIVHGWTRARRTADIVARAVELRVPVAPVLNGRGVLDLDHALARGVFRDDPRGRFRMPRRPWTLDDQDPPALGPAPRLGADTGAVPPARGPNARRTPTAEAPEAPAAGVLAGLKVLDLTTWWAGPSATSVLAALGADVIHLESASRMDGVRLVGATFADQPQWWERSPFFFQINTNKRDLTLDLTTEAGQALAVRLVQWADLLVENYTPRVVEKFGLDWESVHRANPRAVMVRMPAFGLAGPWRDRPGFAQNMEQCTGMAAITGWADEAPMIQRGPCDPNGGLHGAFAGLAALAERDRTGTGHLVEASLFETALNIAAEPIIEWSAYGNLLSRDGNRDPRFAPQGVYACAGPEAWLALSVTDDPQWAALCAVVGWDDLAGDPQLATLEGRRRAQDDLDQRLAAWAQGMDLTEAVAALVAAGVAAAPAIDPRVTSTQPQMAARGFFEEVDHPVAGRHLVPTMPFRMTGVDRWIRRPAPTLGQHNDEILRGVAECSDAELADLARDGVTGTRPRGM
jgi:crotonobetainyl-CoA:carnitine CoA-transferase CaiB-like acyl-CoA transferase